jgi:hypothetical protein
VSGSDTLSVASPAVDVTGTLASPAATNVSAGDGAGT